MKKLLFTIAAFTCFVVSAQVVETPRNGFLPSRVTTAERDAFLDTPGLKGPAKGLVVFNTDTKTLQVNIGTAATPVWQDQQPASNNDAIADCNGKATVVQTITSSTGKVWMDRNLGASRAAQSKTDHYAYGCLYQWGRKTDGHEGIIWKSATLGVPINGSTTAINDDPRHNLFITNSNSPKDWRATQDPNLWGGANRAASPNDPCPTGFRVPSEAEFNAEINAYGIDIGGADTAYSSPHKFVLSGYHNFNGQFSGQADVAALWTKTTILTFSNIRLIYSSGSGISSFERAFGVSIRCIKDINY